ncbi:MAG: CheD, stimulates methylation of protein [Thermoleophilia bacterium]|nr:CheD, stimulates methylation of protein [Thermoleophilia bacterium]
MAGDDARALVTVGLGSCIGVALVDPRTGVVGLAHVFLPEAPPAGAKPGAGPGTYASSGVPELVRRVLAEAGPTAVPRRLVAVIAGGSQMFGGGREGHDVGTRNVAAVRAALAAAGVRISADDIGGNRGRTMRVWPGRDARVTVRTVGSEEREAWSLAPAVPVRSTRLAA